jgi:hypothetical protein
LITSNQLLSKALRQRFLDVCERVQTLEPSSEFTVNLQRQLREAGSCAASLAFSSLKTDGEWMMSDLDCFGGLQALALNEPVALNVADVTSNEEFFRSLTAAARDPQQRFQLLTTRYSFPLNFAHSSEEKVREHVLERLMVQDRAIVEHDSPQGVDADDLLLRLNLISIHAASTTDLRFLDALNYYYELLPSKWSPESRHPWMWASYLALYSRALMCRS